MWAASSTCCLPVASGAAEPPRGTLADLASLWNSSGLVGCAGDKGAYGVGQLMWLIKRYDRVAVGDFDEPPVRQQIGELATVYRRHHLILRAQTTSAGLSKRASAADQFLPLSSGTLRQ
jgi:hypothetical protein